MKKVTRFYKQWKWYLMFYKFDPIDDDDDKNNVGFRGPTKN